MQGGTVFAIYPFNRYRRLEVFGGFTRYQESYNDPAVANSRTSISRSSTGASCSTTAT